MTRTFLAGLIVGVVLTTAGTVAVDAYGSTVRVARDDLSWCGPYDAKKREIPDRSADPAGSTGG